jgi:acyl carrier protein
MTSGGEAAASPEDLQIEKIRGWLKRKKPDLVEIPLDLDLIENRVVDSLLFVDFLLFLEGILGRDLEVKPGFVDPFRTLQSIRDNFLRPGA